MRRIPTGALIALAGIAVLSAAMVPARTHLSVATPALVLVVPVVAGAALGGLWAGAVATVAGFVAYDLLFIRPYGTFSVGAGQNWVALGVYVVVVVVVGLLVVSLQRARADARRRADEADRLAVLSDLLIADKPVTELLQLIVSSIHGEFHPRWAAVLLPEGEALSVAALAGEPLADDELRTLAPSAGRPESLRPGGDGVVRVALAARGRPVGMVAMAQVALRPADWALLRTYANQAALALERSQLREQALRTELLEEADRWRDALIGAVSHDLRTPLASVKAAVTTLRRPPPALGAADRDELLGLIETQSDTLDRLVANLLDATRIQAGALELRRDILPVADLVDAALQALGPSDPAVEVSVDVPADLPPVDIDLLLLQQVLVNLVDNARRHSPDGGRVEVSASAGAGTVSLAVRDHGPGVAPEDRERVFRMFSRSGGGLGRAGLGLAIAKAFVEAHGQSIRVEDAPGSGARFVFTMPAAAVPADTGAVRG